MNGIELAGRALKINYAKEGKYSSQHSQPLTQPSMISMKPGAIYQRNPQFQYAGAVSMPQYQSAPHVSRALYIGNIEATTTYSQLCKLANRFGRLESVSMVESKHCAFLNFLDRYSFHVVTRRRIVVISSLVYLFFWFLSL